LREENCRRYWLDMDLNGLPELPAFVARKQMIVLRKRGGAAGAPEGVRAPAGSRVEWTAEVERARALFREAFGPVGVELPSPVPMP